MNNQPSLAAILLHNKGDKITRTLRNFLIDFISANKDKLKCLTIESVEEEFEIYRKKINRTYFNITIE